MHVAHDLAPSPQTNGEEVSPNPPDLSLFNYGFNLYDQIRYEF
jgi:hypothetical protein